MRIHAIYSNSYAHNCLVWEISPPPLRLRLPSPICVTITLSSLIKVFQSHDGAGPLVYFVDTTFRYGRFLLKARTKPISRLYVCGQGVAHAINFGTGCSCLVTRMAYPSRHICVCMHTIIYSNSMFDSNEFVVILVVHHNNHALLSGQLRTMLGNGFMFSSSQIQFHSIPFNSIQSVM